MHNLQQWPHCDSQIKQYLTELKELMQRQLEALLTGVYLHGSLAMGGFCPGRSDLDLLVVVEHALPPDLRRTLARGIARRAPACPAAKGVELSVITRAAAAGGVPDVPYELHVSPAWCDRILADRLDFAQQHTDSDLPAHLYHTAKRGVVLCGAPILEVFGAGDRALFLQSVLGDLRWALGGGLERDPLYGMLNACRVLMLLQGHPGPCSKLEGGLWGAAHLPPPFSELAAQALQALNGDQQPWDADALDTFSAWLRGQLPSTSTI